MIHFIDHWHNHTLLRAQWQGEREMTFVTRQIDGEGKRVLANSIGSASDSNVLPENKGIKLFLTDLPQLALTMEKFLIANLKKTTIK